MFCMYRWGGFSSIAVRGTGMPVLDVASRHTSGYIPPCVRCVCVPRRTWRHSRRQRRRER